MEEAQHTLHFRDEIEQSLLIGEELEVRNDSDSNDSSSDRYDSNSDTDDSTDDITWQLGHPWPMLIIAQPYMYIFIVVRNTILMSG